MNKVIPEMVAMYYSGKTVKQISEVFGVSVGKVYYLLRDAGCIFRKKGIQPGWHPSNEMIERSAINRRGKKKSAETCKRMSDAKKRTFNGMNGYGHIKPHNTGYILAYVPLHPYARRDGYVMLHRVLVEQKIGRYLTPDEIVHHKNRIRNDNRLENLEVMKKGEHMSMHMKERYKRKDDSLLTV